RGGGTPGNLSVPRTLAEREEMASAKQLPAAPRASETILLVEDNPEVRKVTAQRLENLGYIVVEAASGARAVELLGSGAKIDLVVSDVVMPGGMSGVELARWVGRNAPAVPGLLTAGFAAHAARAGEG